MFQLFKTDSPQLQDAKILAQQLANDHNRVYYVVKICESSYSVTAKTQTHFVHCMVPKL